MYSPEALLEVAKTIRPYLAELIGPKAEAMDTELAILIARCQAGEPCENQLAALLASEEPTREWMAKFLNVDEPSAETTRGGYAPLPGRSPISAPKYVCPQGDYIWYQLDIDDEPPLCPTHNIPLQLADDS